jgi:hypothetical protein
VPVPSAAAVTKSLKLEVALYPTNKSLRSIISALAFVNTSKVTDMSLMFYEAGDFNQDIGSWDISSLTNAIDMFYNNTMMSTANMDTNVLIKGICATKHPIHISYLTNIPTTNVLVKGV